MRHVATPLTAAVGITQIIPRLQSQLVEINPMLPPTLKHPVLLPALKQPILPPAPEQTMLPSAPNTICDTTHSQTPCATIRSQTPHPKHHLCYYTLPNTIYTTTRIQTSYSITCSQTPSMLLSTSKRHLYDYPISNLLFYNLLPNTL